MDQTCSDMQLQHRVNLSDGSKWSSCERVEFTGDTATWELSRAGGYDLLEAYQQTPHYQLIRAINDKALKAFVKKWGPLRVALGVWSGSDPIEAYRMERDRLTAIARLLASVVEPETQRDVLLEWVKVSEGNQFFQVLLAGLRTLFPIPGEVPLGFDENLGPWLETATMKQIETATLFLVSNVPPRTSAAGFTVERSKRGNSVRATLAIRSLVDALDWMVWQDVFQEHPIQFCVECRKFIESKTRHARRFCPDGCAHKRASREFEARKRDKRRKSNGTHKAR